MQIHEAFCTDVLVIGGGGAGARAAIEASRYGVDVTLVADCLFGKGGLTVTGMGGFNVALGNVDRGDNWEVHFNDTVRGGFFLNNQKLAEILVKEAPDRIYDLEDFGMTFNRTEEGKIGQRIESGSTYHRTCLSEDRTGHEMMSTLVNEVLRRDVRIFEETFVSGLLTNNGQIAGAVSLDFKHGNIILFRAGAVVIATGGSGRLFRVTSNPVESIGAGMAMAFQAGAELIDMEMTQFHPTGMVYPESAKGILVSEGVRGDGGILLNKNKERFMTRFDSKKMELSTRDVVSRAIHTEIKEGRGTEHGGVYLDISHVPASEIERKLPTMLAQLLRAGVDIRKEPMEVAPTGHFHCGGVKIDEKTRSSVPGLFACGEGAGGVHGANRLGANSFPTLQVFGARAGKFTAEYAARNGKREVDYNQVERECEKILQPIKQDKGVSPILVRKKIQSLMQDNVGIVRNRQGLESAIHQLKEIKAKEVPKLYVKNHHNKYDLEWIEALRVQKMVELGLIIAKAALLRTESRGVHFREDYPQSDNGNWLKNIIVKLENGEVSLRSQPIVITLLRPN